MTKYLALAVALLAIVDLTKAAIEGCNIYGNNFDGSPNCRTCIEGYNLSKDRMSCNICPVGCQQCDVDTVC